LAIGKHAFPMPYRLFYSFAPGFKGLRCPGRFAILTDGYLCILAGAALTQSWRSPRSLTRMTAALLLAVACLERLPRISGPGAEIETGSRVPQVYRWLAVQPTIRTVLFLPMVRGVADPPFGWDTTIYRETYFSTYHWRKMINGVSGFVPKSYWDLAHSLLAFPDPASVEVARRLPIDAIVVHRKLIRSHVGLEDSLSMDSSPSTRIRTTS